MEQYQKFSSDQIGSPQLDLQDALASPTPLQSRGMVALMVQFVSDRIQQLQHAKGLADRPAGSEQFRDIQGIRFPPSARPIRPQGKMSRPVKMNHFHIDKPLSHGLW